LQGMSKAVVVHANTVRNMYFAWSPARIICHQQHKHASWFLSHTSQAAVLFTRKRINIHLLSYSYYLLPLIPLLLAIILTNRYLFYWGFGEQPECLPVILSSTFSCFASSCPLSVIAHILSHHFTKACYVIPCFLSYFYPCPILFFTSTLIHPF
jgi:hypothetical protein